MFRQIILVSVLIGTVIEGHQFESSSPIKLIKINKHVVSEAKKFMIEFELDDPCDNLKYEYYSHQSCLQTTEKVERVIRQVVINLRKNYSQADPIKLTKGTQMIRYKRGLLDVAFKLAVPAVKYVVGYCLKTVLAKSINWIFPGADIDHIFDQIEIFRNDANVRQSKISYDNEVLNELNAVIGKPLDLYSNQKNQYPLWAIEHKMNILSDKISRLALKSKMGELDTELLFELTQLDCLKQLDPKTVVLEEILQPQNTAKALIFQFTARLKLICKFIVWRQYRTGQM